MRRLIISTLPFLLTVACSGDSTGPEGGPSSHEILFQVNSIVVKGVCDEFPLDADGGEWSHNLTITFPGQSKITIGSTNGYPSAASKKNVGKNGSLAITGAYSSLSPVIEDQEGAEIELRIAATEWDYDVFGNNPSPDPRMDDRSVARTFTFTDGGWPDAPNGALTLESSAACRVDVNYSFEAVAQ